MQDSKKIIIKGKVQGVFFRDFARQNANKYNLTGYVKNLKNGDLEIIIQGNASKITEFTNLCNRGPIFAKVNSIVVTPYEIDTPFEFFDIRH